VGRGCWPQGCDPAAELMGPWRDCAGGLLALRCAGCVAFPITLRALSSSCCCSAMASSRSELQGEVPTFTRGKPFFFSFFFFFFLFFFFLFFELVLF